MKFSPLPTAITAVCAFALGIGATWTYLSHTSDTPNQILPNDPASAPTQLNSQSTQIDELFKDDFFKNQSEPFQHLQDMQERMEALMNQQQSGDLQGLSPMASPFDSWFSGGLNIPTNQISTREDDKHVYYELELGDKTLSDMHVTSENGYVSIEATLTSQTDHSQSQTSLQQTFPVPGNADPTPTVEQLDNKVVVAFEKLTS